MRARQRHRRAVGGVLLLLCGTVTSLLFADDSLPPWGDLGDLPLPPAARSVAPLRADAPIFAEPGKLDARRGSAQMGARLPLFGSRRAGGCLGRWLNVGAYAWMCSDVADIRFDEPSAPSLGSQPWRDAESDLARPFRAGAVGLPPLEPLSASDDGLPYRYYFAGRDGAFGFANLATALDDSPDQELEPGFAVSILEEATAHGQRWGKTQKNRWVAMRELSRSRSILFHGTLVEDGKLDVAWVVPDKADVFGTENFAGKATGTRVRFEMVHVHDEKPTKGGSALRISAEGEPPVWMRSRDLARPRASEPPPEVDREGGSERWIDVDLASQTVVAYAGKTPVFSTIVSTGKGPPGSDTATHPGTFRIWVKVFTTKMDNLDDEEAERHYAIEDVPWVQFFDKAIGFHGAFWHKDFGRVHSHGCVNLAPLDARWLFAFTGPHLPSGWTAALPTRIERGAVVRVK